MTIENCPKECPYKAIEYLSGGYGMPMREKPYCILEKQHRPCMEVPIEDIEDINTDSHRGLNLGA
jgi:hypothetical protein